LRSLSVEFYQYVKYDYHGLITKRKCFHHDRAKKVPVGWKAGRMSAHDISVVVNGRRHVTKVHASRRLIDFLREDLGLTGTKEGCGVGVCGACTVLMDGRAISGCLTFMTAANGREVLTIEGLAKHGVLHPIQKAFHEDGGLQCGFCTPGQIMAAKALLDENPAPTDEEIKHALLGNLCRCTGYYKIIEAVKTAAVKLRALGPGVSA
jgi:carbon-monoxide dehydrogenase small subunit